MAHRLIRACAGREPLLLSVPLVAAALAAVVTVDRFVLHATTALWTYWNEAVTLLASLYTLLRLHFPQTRFALHWMDDHRLPVEGPDGSCTYHFRLSIEGQAPAKVELLVKPAFDVVTLADGRVALSRAVRMIPSLGDTEAGFRDIEVRLSSADLPDARGPLFCKGDLVLEVGLHFPSASSRVLKARVPVCHVVGVGGAAC